MHASIEPNIEASLFDPSLFWMCDRISLSQKLMNFDLVKVCLLSFWLVNKFFYFVCERVVCKDLESKLVCSNDQFVGIFDKGLSFQCFIDFNHKGTNSCSLLCPFMCQDSCRVNSQFVAVHCFESVTNMLLLWCLIE